MKSTLDARMVVTLLDKIISTHVRPAAKLTKPTKLIKPL